MLVRTMMMQPHDKGERNHEVHSAQYYLPITDEEKESFEDCFGLRLMNCYGSTESICWVITDLPYGERRWPSIGRAGLGYEVKVVDEGMCSVPPGTTGEIMVRGVPGITLMKGYYGEPDVTVATIDAEGWMRTGDTGYCDEQGWFFFVDRKSNLIKRSGENVSALEVENVLTEYPTISEAAVIGIPDPVRDQAIKAFLIPKVGCEVDVEDVIAYCKKNVCPASRCLQSLN